MVIKEAEPTPVSAPEVKVEQEIAASEAKQTANNLTQPEIEEIKAKAKALPD